MTDTHVLATAQRLASRALAWLHASHADGLGRIPDNTVVDLSDPDDAYKPLGEIALAASLILRDGVTGPTEARTARELLDHAWAQLREGDLLYERQLRHFTMTDPLETYAHFARAATATRRWRNCSIRSAGCGPRTPRRSTPTGAWGSPTPDGSSDSPTSRTGPHSPPAPGWAPRPSRGPSTG